MPEITYKKVAVKSSAKSEDGKKVRVEVDRVTIPVYPTLEMMIDAIGEKDVLELANRQNATDIKNRARQEATREYSEAGYQKLALQKITDTESTEFIELMEGVAAIQNDPSLTPEAKKQAKAALKQRKIDEVIAALKDRKIVREYDDDADDEEEANA